MLTHPSDAALYGRLGNALRSARMLAESERCYRKGLVIRPDFAALRGALGNVLADRGDRVRARGEMLRAAIAAPELEQVFGALATLSRRDRDLAGVVNVFKLGCIISPTSYRLLLHLGNALSAVGHSSRAAVAFKKAWTTEPGNPAIANNIAATIFDLGFTDEARVWFRRAVVLLPGLASAVNGVANTMKEAADPGLALLWFNRAITIEPGYLDAISNLLFTANYHPDTSAARLHGLHGRWGARFGAPEIVSPKTLGLKMRIGFASADFSAHPVGHFLVGLLENNAGLDVEMVCLSDTMLSDAMTLRLQKAADEWHETRLHDTAHWLNFARDLRLDVLVDMAGHTRNNRLDAIARRVAPAQATWAGYVGTLGLPAVDVLVADPYHIPDGEDVNYMEEVLRLPNGYISYTPPDFAGAERERHPVFDRPFTFASLNNPSKMNRPLIARWARVLRCVSGSQLLLKYKGFDQFFLQSRMQAWFAEEGITADRLLMEAGGNQQEMVEAYSRVDLVLDTWPYSGGATTCEALAMGVPVVTLTGHSFAGRHATSHLANAGFPELAAPDEDGFVALAIELSGDLARLAGLSCAILERAPSSPHRDHSRFAQGFVSGVRRMVEKRT